VERGYGGGKPSAGTPLVGLGVQFEEVRSPVGRREEVDAELADRSDPAAGQRLRRAEREAPEGGVRARQSGVLPSQEGPRLPEGKSGSALGDVAHGRSGTTEPKDGGGDPPPPSVPDDDDARVYRASVQGKDGESVLNEVAAATEVAVGAAEEVP